MATKKITAKPTGKSPMDKPSPTTKKTATKIAGKSPLDEPTPTTKKMPVHPLIAVRENSKEDVSHLDGYASALQGGIIKLYTDLMATNYYEIPEKSILYSEPVQGDTHNKVRVYMQVSTELKFIHPIKAGRIIPKVSATSNTPQVLTPANNLPANNLPINNLSSTHLPIHFLPSERNHSTNIERKLKCFEHIILHLLENKHLYFSSLSPQARHSLNDVGKNYLEICAKGCGLSTLFAHEAELIAEEEINKSKLI